MPAPVNRRAERAPDRRSGRAPDRPVDRLGREGVPRLLWEFSSQTTLSLLVYAIYTVTDTYFLSVGVGPLAAAGAAVVAPVLMALGALSTTVGAGGASVVSRALGQGSAGRASRVVANTFLVFWAAAAVVTVLGTLFVRPIVTLLGATAAIAPYAEAYGRIIFLGALTSTGFSAIIRADGNARYSTAIWIVPVSVNLVLCWLFVMVLGLGAGGAALATVGGQVVSALMSLHFFFLRPGRPYRIRAADFRPDGRLIGEVLLVGLPSLAKNLSAALVAAVTNNLLREIGGDAALSVYAIAGRLSSALLTPHTGLVQGLQPIVGYNHGLGQADRARQAVRLTLAAGVAYGTLAAALCLAAPGALIGLLSTSATVAAQGPAALRLLALALPVSGLALTAAAAFQAEGRAPAALGLTLGGILLVKLPVLVVAARLAGLNGVWASEAASEALLGLIALRMLRRAGTLGTPAGAGLTQPAGG